MVKKGYKQTEIGVLPEDWAIKKLINLSDGGMQNGTFYEGSRKGTGVYFLNVGNLYQTAPIIPQTLGKFDASKDEIDRFRVKNGDLFFTRSSIVPSGIAYCNWYKDSGDNTTVFDSHVVRFKTDTDQVNPMYLYLQCVSQESRNYFISNAKVATMTTIDQAQIGNCLIPVPSLTEQKNIAEAISDADRIIRLLEKLIIKKKAIKQGAMQELLTGKRRLPGFEGAWKTKNLREYCTLVTKQTGFDYSAYIKPALITQKMPNTLPMIQTINFRGRKFAFGTDYYIPKAVALQFPNIVLNEKCVLFSIVGASVGNVGLYPGGTTAFCGGAIGITRFHNEQDAEWVYNYMISPDGQAQIQYVTKGGAQATVTIADIRNFKIPTPEKNERDAISSILENMDHEIEVLEEKLAKYRQVKQGMMQQLLTGKIRLV